MCLYVFVVFCMEKPRYPRGSGQGRGGSRLGIGPPRYCVCPVGGEKFPKARGIPCQEMECEEHGVNLIGVDS